MDGMWNHYPYSLDHTTLDTTTSMNVARNTFDAASGYHSFSTNPGSATAALGASYGASDAIWFLASHAAGGDMWMYNATNGPSDLYLNGSVGSCTAGLNDCLSAHTFGQLHDIRLIVFMGCDSADSAGGSRFQLYATNTLGVDSAVGFTEHIDFSATASDKWAYYFPHYLITGSNVNNAAVAAEQAVLNVNGSYGGYNSYYVSGSTVYVEPAGYGS